MLKIFINRFLLRIGMNDAQAEAVSAWLASLFDKAELGPRLMTPDEEREHFERKTPPMNS